MYATFIALLISCGIGGFFMRDVKKVLGMRSQNHSQRDIAHAIKISRDTVRRIFNAADSKKICWSSVQDLSEYNVQKLLFEEEVKLNMSIKQSDAHSGKMVRVWRTISVPVVADRFKILYFSLNHL